MSQGATRTPAALSRHDLTARQAITAACALMAVLAAIDLADGHLGFLFSLGFVLIVVTVPLSVDARSLFPAGVLPPALLLGTLLIVAAIRPDAIHVQGLSADASTLGRFLAATIDHGMTLVVGHGLALVIIALRVVTTPDT